MRALLILGGLCLLLVGGLMLVVLMDGDEGVGSAVSSHVLPVDQPKMPEGKRFGQDRTRPVSAGKAVGPGSRAITEKNVIQFGKEFHDKWYQDRELLGIERHQEMEDLWLYGRRPRGSMESIKKLEQVVRDFGNTNRAGCAAMELGHHYIRNRSMGLEERRKKAEYYWHLAEDRYRDSLCEYNSHPAALSKLGLAAWVYRKKDPAMARRLLKEISEEHKGETDHLGKPLEESVQRILKTIR